MQPFPGTGDTSPRLRGVIGGPARSASFCDDQDDDDDDDGDDGGDETDDDAGDGDDNVGAIMMVLQNQPFAVMTKMSSR